MISVFADAALFPRLPVADGDAGARLTGHRTKDYYGRSTKREDMNMEITSPIVGFQLSEYSKLLLGAQNPSDSSLNVKKLYMMMNAMTLISRSHHE